MAIPGIYSGAISKFTLGLLPSIGPSLGANICNIDVSPVIAPVYGSLTSQVSGYETVRPKNALLNCVKPSGVAAGVGVVVVGVTVCSCGVIALNCAYADVGKTIAM